MSPRSSRGLDASAEVETTGEPPSTMALPADMEVRAAPATAERRSAPEEAVRARAYADPLTRSRPAKLELFIVRPRDLSPLRVLSLARRQLAPECRQLQIDEVAAVRREDRAYGELERWLDEKAPTTASRVSTADASAVSGSVVLRMSEEAADELRRELPDLLLVRDQPLDLIRPSAAAGTLTSSPSIQDLWHLRSIGLEAARKAGFKGTGAGVLVAVLDTGIDEEHQELAGRVAGAVRFDGASQTSVPFSPSIDTDGHGTHVAGLICGKRVGVAPAVRVVNGLMIPNGRGWISDFVLALEWAGNYNGVQIVNMSAGLPGYLEGMHDVVAGLLAVGVLPVIATGNEGRNQTRSPGNYSEPLSVGASTRDNRVASFSSSGIIVADSHEYTVPDVIAPGKDVYSCVVGGGYEAWNGTSMATPIVSGIAALVLERYPLIHLTDLVDLLLETSIRLADAPERQGRGLVQVEAANDTRKAGARKGGRATSGSARARKR